MASTFIYQHREPKLSVVLATPHTFSDIALTVAHWRAQTVQEDVELVLVSESLNKLAIPDGTVDGFAAVLWVKGTRQVTLGEARTRCATIERADHRVFRRPRVPRTRMGLGHDSCAPEQI